jgi:hypothetical protein
LVCPELCDELTNTNLFNNNKINNLTMTKRDCKAHDILDVMHYPERVQEEILSAFQVSSSRCRN